MSRVYLLCGPSLSGKSTAAARLASALGAVIVSADEINAERGLPFGAEGLPESTWAETLERETERLRAHVAQGRDVVVDDTLCYRWLRDRFRDECRELRAQTRLLVLAPGHDELSRRREGILQDGSRPVLGIDRFQEHLRTFEWPREDERPIPVTDAAGLEAFIQSEAGTLR